MFILLLIIAWCLAILYPFTSIILWSFIIALAIYPLHTILSKKMGGRPRLASVIIVLAILAVIIVPIGLMIGSLVDDVKKLKELYDAGGLAFPDPPEKIKEWPIIGQRLFDFWDNLSVSLGQTLDKYKEQLASIGSKIAKGILGGAGDLVKILASVIIAGILMIYGGTGEAVHKFFRKIAGERGDEFADLTFKTVGNVVKGVIGVAFIMAVLNGILFFLAGVPYAGIWTLLIFILSTLQIPLFIVTVPVIIYLFVTKEPVPAIIWGALFLVSGLADNVLRPLLLGKGASVPMLVIFIGVIGGFILSGFLGLFTGAIVLSLGYKLYISWVD
ncbi:MAG: AI-2E family transporter [Bacteroidia bacterium]|nr:MAG: AI-2E family transporter [Bacteroidia bacterium]